MELPLAENGIFPSFTAPEVGVTLILPCFVLDSVAPPFLFPGSATDYSLGFTVIFLYMYTVYTSILFPYRAILCKGLNYPPVHPKPVMSTLSLKLPLCEVNTEKSQLEVGIFANVTISAYHLSAKSEVNFSCECVRSETCEPLRLIVAASVFVCVF